MTPSDRPPATIVTFYSYKGGVGRSMALANVAVLLAQRGLKVLAVDWDLEAPGLERYFSYFPQRTRAGGLLPFFARAFDALRTGGQEPSYREFVWTIAMKEGEPFDLLPSGRDNHADYAKLLEAFDWREFFAVRGGDFIERLRTEWRSQYDIVLIDSRTGMSDSGGICTIQLPDVLVTMFTANEQSMNGVRDIIEAAQRGRQRLAYDRMPLTVLPVLCRFASGTEIQESAKWLDTLAVKFQNVCDDWRPPWVAPRVMLERLKVPQVDFYGFGERLAVIEQGVSDPTGMGYAFDRITDLLASGFEDLEGALGTAARKPHGWTANKARAAKVASGEIGAGSSASVVASPAASGHAASAHVDEGYKYDIFVSYRRGGVVDEWVRRFTDDLKQWLMSAGLAPRIFLDTTSAMSGDAWEPAIEAALLRSKLLVAVLTPPYFTSPHCGGEWLAFERRQAQIPRSWKPYSPNLILPILLQGEVDLIPTNLRGRLILRAPVDTLVSIGKNVHDVNYAKVLQEVSSFIANALVDVPPFDEGFPRPVPTMLATEGEPSHLSS